MKRTVAVEPVVGTTQWRVVLDDISHDEITPSVTLCICDEEWAAQRICEALDSVFGEEYFEQLDFFEVL